MNELFGFLSTARDFGGLYLVIVLATAAGFFFFDRRRPTLRIVARDKAATKEQAAA